MNNEEKVSINRMKLFARSSDLSIVTAKDMEIVVNLIEKQAKEIEDKKEEMYVIGKTNYILGQTDERSQWYKKINEKYEELTQEEKETDGIVMNTKEKKILKELIGKEE